MRARLLRQERQEGQSSFLHARWPEAQPRWCGYHLYWIHILRSAERSTAFTELPATRVRRDRFDIFLTVPVIGPVLLLLAGNADFMFDPPGWIDAFGMVGRFWHYADQNPL